MTTRKPRITFTTQQQAAPATAMAAPARAPAYVAAAPAAPSDAGVSGFVTRNALPLAVGCIFVLTFVLGIMTAVIFMGGSGQTATAPAPVTYAKGLDDTVTRAVAPALSDISGATAPAAENPLVADLAVAVLEGLTPQPTVGKLTEDELAQKAAEAKAIVQNNKLRMLREGVLAGIYSVEAVNENGQRRIKLNTVNAEVTAELMADIIRKASDEGRIEIPASLSTSEGGIDMDTMMFNLVQTSLANDGTAEGAEAAREMSRRAFAASNAKTTDVAGARVYTVEAGDSLAYISLQFYGKPSEFQRIFEANRDTLQSPDKLQIGQRLKIPS
ncbi:LysM peptidoglycan-binding domain-containing protein [Sulfitobacter sp. S190]|uniref:LysM peptidoglycan-binding domain-containing protein n=1 Tax=Sulfitobacter sp. S190 TaxID=2867022 RepID=UPI0021A8E5A2|nr:LysM peptidoglycan-binding domain-containing protein [Sulfitobacter sp. S190]UWR22187.1 LysM peptidoglycan-binding domain-containing protein [Sulfitobacter sp. S190]